MKYCNTNRVKGKLSRFCCTEQGYEYNAHATADQCKLNGNRTNERPKRQRARKKRKKLIYSSADYTHADDADSEHTTAEKKKAISAQPIHLFWHDWHELRQNHYKCNRLATIAYASPLLAHTHGHASWESMHASTTMPERECCLSSMDFDVFPMASLSLSLAGGRVYNAPNWTRCQMTHGHRLLACDVCEYFFHSIRKWVVDVICRKREQKINATHRIDGKKHEILFHFCILFSQILQSDSPL